VRTSYGILSGRLEALRERLLDLTLKNRLLNHSDRGKRMLKVDRVALGKLYRLLLEEGKSFKIWSPAESPRSVSNEPGSEAYARNSEVEAFELDRADVSFLLGCRHPGMNFQFDSRVEPPGRITNDGKYH
jgi:hypothetical protein